MQNPWHQVFPYEGMYAQALHLLTTSEILAKLKAYGNIARETSLRNMSTILSKHGYKQLRKTSGRFWLGRELRNMELTYNRTASTLQADDSNSNTTPQKEDETPF